MDVCKLPPPHLQIPLTHPTSTHTHTHQTKHGQLNICDKQGLESKSEDCVRDESVRNLCNELDKQDSIHQRFICVHRHRHAIIFSLKKIPRFWQQNHKDFFSCVLSSGNLFGSQSGWVHSLNGILNTCFGCSLLRKMTGHLIKWYLKCHD